MSVNVSIQQLGLRSERAQSSSVRNIHKQLKQINEYYKQRPLVTRRKRFCSSCIIITTVFVARRCRKEATAGGPSPLGNAYTKHFVIYKDKRKIKICKLGTNSVLAHSDTNRRYNILTWISSKQMVNERLNNPNT